jgi:hypothetical protein
VTKGGHFLATTFLDKKGKMKKLGTWCVSVWNLTSDVDVLEY